MTAMCAYPSCTAATEPGYDVCTGHASRTLLRIMLRNAQRERDEALRVGAKMTGALEDIADSEDEHGVPSSADWMSRRAAEVLRECAKEKR